MTIPFGSKKYATPLDKTLKSGLRQKLRIDNGGKTAEACPRCAEVNGDASFDRVIATSPGYPTLKEGFLSGYPCPPAERFPLGVEQDAQLMAAWFHYLNDNVVFISKCACCGAPEAKGGAR